MLGGNVYNQDRQIYVTSDNVYTYNGNHIVNVPYKGYIIKLYIHPTKIKSDFQCNSIIVLDDQYKEINWKLCTNSGANYIKPTGSNLEKVFKLIDKHIEKSKGVSK